MRLYPWHAKKFFSKVQINTYGEIIYEPVKIALAEDMIYLEVHEDVYNFYQDLGYIINKKIKILDLEKKVDYSKINQAVEKKQGIPINITKENKVH